MGAGDEVRLRSNVNLKKGTFGLPKPCSLQLEGGRLRCATPDDTTVFDVAVTELGDLDASSLLFMGTAFKVQAAGTTYLCSFQKLRSNGLTGVGDIGSAKGMCTVWKDKIAEAKAQAQGG
jgi:hypothetical protein